MDEDLFNQRLLGSLHAYIHMYGEEMTPVGIEPGKKTVTLPTEDDSDWTKCVVESR